MGMNDRITELALILKRFAPITHYETKYFFTLRVPQQLTKCGAENTEKTIVKLSTIVFLGFDFEGQTYPPLSKKTCLRAALKELVIILISGQQQRKYAPLTGVILKRSLPFKTSSKKRFDREEYLWWFLNNLSCL